MTSELKKETGSKLLIIACFLWNLPQLPEEI